VFLNINTKFSNKCDVGIVYVFRVEIIRIFLKFYSLGVSLLSFKFGISKFLQLFFINLFLKFAQIFPFFSQQKLPSQ
jgi:hypothetical protein